MAMGPKHLEGGKFTIVNSRVFKSNFRTTNTSTIQRNSPHRAESTVQKLSSTKGHSPQGSGPRTSPNLMAGHYAGCKFSEPPLPSTLPLPPKHWMQATRSSSLNFHSSAVALSSDHKDVTQQLKMLLKVQA